MPMLMMPHESTTLPYGGIRTILREIGAPFEDDSDLSQEPPLWTGCLVLADSLSGRVARIWLDENAVYAAHMSGYTPAIALRLRSSGCLTEEEYILYAQYNPVEAGPAAVEELNVSPAVVEEIHREVLLATLSHLYEWELAVWHWEDGEFTDEYITSGIPALLATAAVDERIGQWNAVVRTRPEVVQPHTVPVPGPAWESKIGVEVTPEMAFLLSQVDGERTIARIAAAGGFTRFEIARLLAQAAADNVLLFTHKEPAAPSPVKTPEIPEASITVPHEVNDMEREPVLLDIPSSEDERPSVEIRDPGDTADLISSAMQDISTARQALDNAEARLRSLAHQRGLPFPS